MMLWTVLLVCAAVALDPEEMDALRTLRMAFRLPESIWAPDQDGCSLRGVVCEHGHVVRLQLAVPSRAPVPLPHALGGLSHLKHLAVTGGMVAGGLSSAVVKALTALEVLDLSGNPLLGGTIPPDLPKTLTALRLEGGGFFGVVPKELGEGGSLNELDLRGNRLRGTLPASLRDIGLLRLFPGNRGLEHDDNPDFDVTLAIDYGNIQDPSTCRD